MADPHVMPIASIPETCYNGYIMNELMQKALDEDHLITEAYEKNKQDCYYEIDKLVEKYIEVKYYRGLNLDISTVKISETDEGLCWFICGNVLINDLDIKLTLKVFKNFIKFESDPWTRINNNTFYYSNEEKFELFVSRMLVNIQKETKYSIDNDLKKINELVERGNYDYLISNLKDFKYISNAKRNEILANYSWPAKKQQLEKEFKAAKKKFSDTIVNQFRQEYTKQIEEKIRIHNEAITEFEKKHFKPFATYSIVCLPKDISIAVDSDDPEALTEALYCEYMVTSDQPDQDGYYTLCHNKDKIKILGSIVSIVKKETKEAWQSRYRLAVPKSPYGYNYKQEIHINPNMEEELRELINKTEFPEVITLEDFLQSKGCVKNGYDWFFPGA